MKNLLTAGCFIFIMAGCSQSIDLSKEIPGAYSMTEQIIQQGDQLTHYKDLKQLKIYTDNHFMFTQINPKDSSAEFGIGSYSTSGDSLTEHSMYSSNDTSFTDQPKDYNLDIDITPEGYNQIIKGIVIDGQQSKLTEYYNKVKDSSTSPMDGVWKETKSYVINGTDTAYNDRTQYKAFYNGYFMFGNTVMIGPGKTSTGMGYGIFKMISDNHFQETDLNSSYPVIAGNTFEIDLEMNGKDHFKQIVKNADGSLGVEFYERVK